MTFSGSGNYLVDLYDEWEEEQWRLSKILPCGCYLNCVCDEDDI